MLSLLGWFRLSSGIYYYSHVIEAAGFMDIYGIYHPKQWGLVMEQG